MIFPAKTETWAVSHPPEMVAAIMRLHVKLAERQEMQSDTHDPRWMFNGMVGEEQFSISPIIRSPDNFIPLIKGRWIGSESGSLLELQYQLFGSTLMFLIFWSVICLVGAAFLSVFFQEYMLALSLLLIGFLNYWVTLANFKKRVKECSNKLLEILH